MSERKTETIDIGHGVQYAKVASRLAEFHKDHSDGRVSLTTHYEMKDGLTIFSAVVAIDGQTFTGHALGKLSGRQKEFEKLETIAVGRALAFAGYLASGEIACAEEMADVVSAAQINSLKMRFLKANPQLSSKGKFSKGKEFQSWAMSIVGEEVNYSDPQSWNREWYETCWRNLSDSAADVPFEA